MSTSTTSQRGGLSSTALALIPIAIAINVALGQLVQSVLKLPIYLDSIGTVLVGVLLGPLAGAITGLLANIIWGLTLAPAALPFAASILRRGVSLMSIDAGASCIAICRSCSGDRLDRRVCRAVWRHAVMVENGALRGADRNCRGGDLGADCNVCVWWCDRRGHGCAGSHVPEPWCKCAGCVVCPGRCFRSA